MTNDEIISTLENAPAKLQSFKTEVGKVIIGQEEAVDLITMSILCQGHSLLVGVPGLAKTLLITRLTRRRRNSSSRDSKRIRNAKILPKPPVSGCANGRKD